MIIPICKRIDKDCPNLSLLANLPDAQIFTLAYLKHTGMRKRLVPVADGLSIKAHTVLFQQTPPLALAAHKATGHQHIQYGLSDLQLVFRKFVGQVVLLEDAHELTLRVSSSTFRVID